MQLPEISFEIDDRVAFVILKGEDGLNRVTAGMYEDLSIAVDSIIDDGSVRVVVVMGEGSVFSGGTEEAVKELRDRGGEGMIGASGAYCSAADAGHRSDKRGCVSGLGTGAGPGLRPAYRIR